MAATGISDDAPIGLLSLTKNSECSIYSFENLKADAKH
jgi:hypothetical protein